MEKLEGGAKGQRRGGCVQMEKVEGIQMEVNKCEYFPTKSQGGMQMEVSILR
jgi:hypothetical protein